MSKPMMKCGCVASSICTRRNGEVLAEPIPACVVHECYGVAETAPDLTGRTAQCAYGGHAPKPSSPDLAFFEFRGEGSRDATEICRCGFHRRAHEIGRAKGCAGFTPKGPQEFDRYYCGCHGWD
jgi:hypothetical protein